MLELLVAMFAGTTVIANIFYAIEFKRNDRLQNHLLGLCEALSKDLKISNERHDGTAERLAMELSRIGKKEALAKESGSLRCDREGHDWEYSQVFQANQCRRCFQMEATWPQEKSNG